MGSYYQSKWASILIVLLIVAVIVIWRHDNHKDERATLSTQISGIEADLVQLKDEYAGLSKEIDTFTSEINQQSDTLQQHLTRRTKLQDDLALYVLDHKIATAAVMATVAGTAGILNDNTNQETKDTLKPVVVIAVGYCLFNAEECGSVAARVLYSGSQIESETKIISNITELLSRKKMSLKERKEKNSSLGDMISTKIAERDTLQREHDSLLCRFCL